MNETLITLPFRDRLTEQEKTFCEQNAFVQHYKEGAYILGECESGCRGMLHILSGEIRAFIISEEGREITLFRLGAGENCVLSASCALAQITFETQIEVVVDAEILIIPASAYAKLMESNIYVRCFTYELAAERFSAVMWVMQQIIFYGFDKRLADFLLAEYRRTGSPAIRMTQEAIAQSVNSAREVVARMLRQFASDGLIESRRGEILLRDIAGLERIK